MNYFLKFNELFFLNLMNYFLKFNELFFENWLKKVDTQLKKRKINKKDKLKISKSFPGIT